MDRRVMRLADRLLIPRRVFDQDALLEGGTGVDEGDKVGSVDSAEELGPDRSSPLRQRLTTQALSARGSGQVCAGCGSLRLLGGPIRVGVTKWRQC